MFRFTSFIRKRKIYKISVFTSKSSDSIDSLVRIMITGSRGNSGWLDLKQNFDDAKLFGFTIWHFQNGSSDSFVRESFDLGKISSVQIEHDGSDPYKSGSRWKVKKVEIEELTRKFESKNEKVFLVDQWNEEKSTERVKFGHVFTSPSPILRLG